MKKLIHVMMVSGLAALSVLSSIPLHAGELQVNSYYGKYDVAQKKPGFPAPSLQGPVAETWITPTPKKPYRIGVLFPHLKDSYWVAADYGIMSHAKALGVNITLHEAGAYINFGNQKMQLTALATGKKVDGIILASVDYTKMDQTVAEVVNSGVPVIELINDIRAPKITAKSLVSFFEMGYKAGEFVINDSGGKALKIAFFPGPENSGWAPETYDGFNAAVSRLKHPNQQITMIGPFYGDTRPEVQALRLEQSLNKTENYQMDYIVGNAVAVVEAVNYLAQHRTNYPNTQIVSTYITPTVYEQMTQGTIAASPSDQTIDQCRIALDMMVRLLNGEQPGKDFPFRAGPIIPLITKDTLAQYRYEDLFGEKNFVPVVQPFTK